MDQHLINYSVSTTRTERTIEKLEKFFKQDFSEVKVNWLQAKEMPGCAAYTIGSQIFLSNALVSLSDTEFQSVLAHELTHYLQQKSGRIKASNVNDGELYIDQELEAEAEMVEFLVSNTNALVDTLPSWVMPPVTDSNLESPVTAMQPIVTVQGRIQNLDYCWKQLEHPMRCPHLASQKPSKAEMKKLKSKLKHWIDAPAKRSYFSTSKKGHNKEFPSYDNLSRALFGRIRSVDSKKYEAQLASTISKSGFINQKLKTFVKRLKRDFHDAYADNWQDNHEVSRYAYFYSKGISGIQSSKLRNTEDAFDYLINNKVPNYKIAAFLADYSMIARDYVPNMTQEQDSLCALDILPESDARSTHYNVDESNDWVKAARAANVRLGAGPSATTMQVLKMGKIAFPENDTLLAIALALFEFWNSHANQKRSEIHTYHEVMVVAKAFGVVLEPDMENPGQFEYPSLNQIP